MPFKLVDVTNADIRVVYRKLTAAGLVKNEEGTLLQCLDDRDVLTVILIYTIQIIIITITIETMIIAIIIVITAVVAVIVKAA